MLYPTFNLNLLKRGANSSTNILNLLINEEEPMTSKYNTMMKNKTSISGEKLNEQQKTDNNAAASYTESIVESMEMIKANNIENDNNDANMHIYRPPYSVSKPHTARRPDSLKLSFEYGSTSNLGKTIPSNNNVNQTKSMSAVGSKSHHDGKKSTSYDLWVNENISKVMNNNDAESKKLDLPGRVSFRLVSEKREEKNPFF